MFDGPDIWEFLKWVVPLVVSVIQAVQQPIVEIWEFLKWVVPLVVSVIQAIRQPIVEDIIHRSVDALWGFVSGELGRLWRFARQKKPQKIEEELKTQIKEVEAENELLREKNGAMEKQVVDLQKIEEDLKTTVKEVEAENQMLSERNQKLQKKVVDLQMIEEQLKIEKNYIIEVAAKNAVQLKKDNDDLVAKNEVLDKKVVDLQKIEEELKTKIEEAGAENKMLTVNNEAMEKKLVQSPVQLSGQYQGSFGGQILSLTFDGKLSIIKSNIGEEGGIPLGPWGGNGGGYWAYNVDVAPILEITLVYGQVIDSILVTSKSRDGSVIGCSDRFGGPDGQYTATLCIDSSVEQLSAISLTYGDWLGMTVITSLSFYSNRGRYGPYGWRIGSTVSIPIEEGTILAGLHGRCGHYLDAFGVLLAPKVLYRSHKASGSGLRLEEI